MEDLTTVPKYPSYPFAPSNDCDTYLKYEYSVVTTFCLVSYGLYVLRILQTAPFFLVDRIFFSLGGRLELPEGVSGRCGVPAIYYLVAITAFFGLLISPLIFDVLARRAIRRDNRLSRVTISFWAASLVPAVLLTGLALVLKLMEKDMLYSLPTCFDTLMFASAAIAANVWNIVQVVRAFRTF